MDIKEKIGLLIALQDKDTLIDKMRLKALAIPKAIEEEKAVIEGIRLDTEEKKKTLIKFQLSKKESSDLSRSQSVTLKRGQNIKFLPYAFTEYGAIQAANVVNSKIATQASIAVVRAFARLREMVSAHKELAAKLAELEQRLSGHDTEIKAIVDVIRQLMTGLNQPQNDKHSGPKRQIGFKPE